MSFQRVIILILVVGVVEGIDQRMVASAEIELGKVLITNRRTEIGVTQATENVTVIDEAELKELPAHNLSEALSFVSGVDIESRRGFARATSVTVQGSDSRQVRVMIDGIPLNNQASGQVDLTKFPIENVARIEVIKGASSSLWGSSLGGVINVVTKDTGTTAIPQGSVTTSFAEFRTKQENAEVAGKVSDLGYYLFSGYMESGGRGRRDDTLVRNVFSKVSYTTKFMNKIIASFGYSESDINSGELPNGSWQAQPYRARYGRISWEGSLGNSVDLAVSLKNSRQDIVTKTYLTIDEEEPLYIVRTEDVLYQLSLVSTIHPREDDLLVLGTDFDWDTLDSTYLNEAKSLKLQAPYANYTLKLEPWDFNFGLRYDHNSEYGEEFSPSLKAVYHFRSIPGTLIRAGVSRAFNAPPLLWKYYDLSLSGLTINPDIGPERAWVYELGLESEPSSRFWIKLSLYRADVSDAIGNSLNDLGEWIKKNFQKFRRQGGELQLRVNLTDELSFFGSGAFNDIEDRATGQTVRGGGKPRQSFDIGMEYKSESGFSVILRGYYDRWNEPAEVEPNDRKMLCDLKMMQEFEHLALFLNVYNLTNSKYWADSYFPLPQRYFEGGVTLKW